MSKRDEAFSLAKRFVLEANQKTSAVGPDGFTDTERTGGDLVVAIVEELAPVMRDLRRPLVLLQRWPDRLVVDRDRTFRRLSDDGSGREGVPAALLLRLEPDLRAILNRLDVELLALNDPRATAGAMLVRDLRDVLEAALAGPPSRPIGPSRSP